MIFGKCSGAGIMGILIPLLRRYWRGIFCVIVIIAILDKLGLMK
jgi:hypothetical protein